MSSNLIEDITGPGRPEVHDVSDGIFAYIQPDRTCWIDNTGFLVGPLGVVSVDSCSTKRRTCAYQAAIASFARDNGSKSGTGAGAGGGVDTAGPDLPTGRGVGPGHRPGVTACQPHQRRPHPGGRRTAKGNNG